MDSGKLRHRVKVMARRMLKDASGQSVSEWAELGERMAAITPTATRNWIVGDQDAVGRQFTVRMRMLEGVRETMRLKYGERTLEILAVMPDATFERDLILQVVEVSGGEL